MLCLSYKDLRARGIPFSRQWLNVLIKKGEFPRPLKLGMRSVAFDAQEIEAWLQARADKRDIVEKDGGFSSAHRSAERMGEV